MDLVGVAIPDNVKAKDIEGPATTKEYVNGTHKENLQSRTDEVNQALEKTNDALGTRSFTVALCPTS